MNNYDDLNFCINLIDDFIDNRTKYKVEPIVINEIKLNNILKEEIFDYKKILDNLEFYKIVNDKNVYFAKNYEVHISKYTGKITNLSTKQNIGILYNYIFSEFLTQHNLDNILLNLMNFTVVKNTLKNVSNLDNFDDNDELLISIYYNKSETLSDFLKSNKNNDNIKKIFFIVLFSLYKFSSKLKNFRHNNLNLDSIRITKTKLKKNTFNIGDIKFSFDFDFDVRITDFENSSSTNISNFLSINNRNENPFYDVHYFLSAFMNFVHNNNYDVNDKIIHFIESIIPEKYRNFNDNNFKLDEKVFNSDETHFIIPSDILKKNIFFSDFILNKMDITVTPISSLSENSLDKYSKKDKKINYDIEINSLTETSNNNSRMIAKNIKYKNKKTYSNYNNIKDSMIKGTRRLYVPTRNNLNEGNISSDVLATVEKDRKERRDKKDRRREKKSEEEEDNNEVEIDEVEDESSIENDEVKMERSKGKKSSKKSSKGKKSKKTLSESSLESLSSDGVDTYHQKSITGTEVEKRAGRKMKMEPEEQNDILKMLPEGYSGPVPQSLWANMQQPQQTGPKINSIGRALGHSEADMTQPQGLPPAPIGLPEMGMPNMGGMDMSQMMASQQAMPQMGMPQMGMPQMGMPQMGMPQMGMPQMGMPQMQQTPQSVLLSEGSMMQQAQQQLQASQEPVAAPAPTPAQPQMTFQQALQQGGSRQKRILSLKKDFFF